MQRIPIESLESRTHLSVTAIFVPVTGALTVFGDSLPNNIVVSRDAAGKILVNAGAVQINVNAAGGGTGTAALDSITVPVAGTLTVATNTGGNLTGGAITQNVGTSLSVGTAQLSTGNGAITPYRYKRGALNPTPAAAHQQTGRQTGEE